MLGRRSHWRGAIVMIALGSIALPTLVAQQVVRLESVVRIGCAQCDGPDLFSKVSALALTSGGTVIVGDEGDKPVRMFDRTGRLIWAGGRKGNGPGEIGHVSYLSAREDGTWDVLDRVLSRRSWFGSSGHLIRTASLPGLMVAASYSGGAGAMYLATTAMGDNSTAIFQWQDSAAEPRQVLGALKFPLDSSGQQLLSFPIATLPASGFTVGDPYGYRIRAYDERGVGRMDLARNVPRRQKTPDEVAEDRSAMMSRKAAVMSRARQGIVAAPLPPVDPLRTHFSNVGLAYDDLGRLWVLAGRSTEGASIMDVFGADGKFISEVRLPVSLRYIALRGPYLAGLEVDTEGIEFVHLWRITNSALAP